VITNPLAMPAIGRTLRQNIRAVLILHVQIELLRAIVAIHVTVGRYELPLRR
jgi:hypothetical protein